MSGAPFGSRELFRYTRITPLLMVDLTHRAMRAEKFRFVIESDKTKRTKWAQDYLDSNKVVRSLSQLQTKSLASLSDSLLESAYLPTSGEIGCDLSGATEEKTYPIDVENALGRALSLKILGEDAEADRMGRMLQLIEAVPRLGSMNRRQRYAPVVLSRFDHKAPPADDEDGSKPESALRIHKKNQKEVDELDRLSALVSTLWQAQARELKARRRDLEEKHRKERVDRRRPPLPRGEECRKEAIEQAQAYFRELRDRREQLAKERRALRESEDRYSLSSALSASAESMATAWYGLDSKRIAEAQEEAGALIDKYKIDISKFCRAIEETGRQSDKKKETKALSERFGSGGGFTENPRIKAKTSVRLLGNADLIRVDEQFIRYTEGEISYVENILAGEVRKREVKNTKYFEQLTESTTEEVTENERERSSTVSQDLSSEVQNEINTRMQSDVNASAEASGGGSIGVVDFKGGGSLNAGFGVGVDTSFSTSSRSEFSQEIVSRSIEQTRRSTLSRRLNRTYALYETTNLHKIDNTGDSHRRGVYVFLDKHICIKETTYGRRTFLMANVMVPGKNLLREQRARMAYQLHGVGQRPTFDITPDDVQPGSYKDLVGRFQATNVSPPPDPLIRLGRTYKTDQTNLTKDTDDGKFKLKDVADVLVPFFERFQRFAVHDTIKLPDGYEVQEVLVTVNHGSNGVSIPMHLPISIAGAGMYMGPSLLYSMLFPWLYLPFTVWQLAYMASPLMHYNTDSSNVTVCIGNESEDSRYYFMSPDEMIAELFEFLSNFLALSPGIMEQIQTRVGELLTDLANNGGAIPQQVLGDVQTAISSLVGKLGEVFAKIMAALNPVDSQPVPTFDDPNGELFQLGEAINEFNQGITVTLSDLSETLDDNIFQPLREFMNDVVSLIGGGIQNAISDFMAMILEQTDNSQVLYFVESFGARKELPISLNMVAIHPAITVNVVTCLRRTEEALDQWRLETFGNLYHAYLQQLAEYEARLAAHEQPDDRRSPGTMRSEERRTMKELVLHALNNYHTNRGNNYSLESMNLFEHAIDWESVSYRLYNYGPNGAATLLESLGFFRAADARRRAFLTAHWAQVLLPLQPKEELEKAMIRYFEGDHEFSFEQDLSTDELTALYQDLILGRRLAEESPEVEYRQEVVPTDFIVLMPDDALPENPQTACAEAVQDERIEQPAGNGQPDPEPTER